LSSKTEISLESRVQVRYRFSDTFRMKGIWVKLIKKYWFLLGLIAVFLITVGDPTAIIAEVGNWIKIHYGPGIVIFVIFLVSGMLLEPVQIRQGLTDFKGILLALGIIFLMGPLVAVPVAWTGLDTGIKIGLFVVAVMPTTLSSGVVMTGTAGGNIAHALVITVLANSLAIVTIPVSLDLLLGLIGSMTEVVIDKVSIMLKLAFLVLVPLACGLGIKFYGKSALNRITPKLQMVNQCLILAMVWMALSPSRETILHSGPEVVLVCLLVFVYHGCLLGAAALAIYLFKLERGRRESVLFMGAQKTLTLSVILQVSLFPEYGIALAVCVLHHIIHMIMDGYLAGKLAPAE